MVAPRGSASPDRKRARDTREFRLPVGGIRARREREPSRPVDLIAEPGVGYRLTGSV